MFSSIITGLLETINNLGYWGIFIGMIIESSVFPLPSEFILLPAGALIAQGKMHILPVIIASTFGSIIGALINYSLAFFLGRKAIEKMVRKYGKFLLIDEEKMRKSDEYFNKYGSLTTFVGRFILVVRHLISLPAGFSRMNIFKFCFYTGLGAGLWSLFLIYAGYFLGSAISTEMKIIASAIAILIGITVFVVCEKLRKKH